MKKTLLIFSLLSLLLPAISQAAPAEARLRGKILLQVESNGEAWYVKPNDGTRIYLKDGDVAYDLMRNEGLGISNADLAKIPVGFQNYGVYDADNDNDGLLNKIEESIGTDINNSDTDGDGRNDGDELKNGYNPLGLGKLSYSTSLVNRFKGQILLQVQSQGQAWYINPVDGKRYYMANGMVAYQMMRYMSLGISNTNLNKITVNSKPLITVDSKKPVDSKPVDSKPVDSSPEILVFVSPQYKDDAEISKAIQDYASAVKTDIRWETKIIKLSLGENNYKKIDKYIEDEYKKTNGALKASIMVGEDINTALKHDYIGNECPSTVPWSTIGEEAYTYPVTGVQSYDSKMKVAISLLYPAHNLDYQTKAKQLVFTFQKFSANRNQIFNKNSNIFIALDAPMEDNEAKIVFDTLCTFGQCPYKGRIAPTLEEINESLSTQYMMHIVLGHAARNLVSLGQENFSTKYLNTINSPLVVIGGCFTDCWTSEIWEDNNVLDYSTEYPEGFISPKAKESWFSNEILTSPNVKVIILGAPTQVGNNFVNQALPGLLSGKTMAEAMIDKTYSTGDVQQLIGDPTFHYNF